jgi:hypothetical protein
MLYGLQTCLALKYQEYMAYNITCGYINFNDSHGYGRLKYLTSCYGVYAMHYSCKLEVTYQKYYHKYYIT